MNLDLLPFLFLQLVLESLVSLKTNVLLLCLKLLEAGLMRQKEKEPSLKSDSQISMTRPLIFLKRNAIQLVLS